MKITKRQLRRIIREQVKLGSPGVQSILDQMESLDLGDIYAILDAAPDIANRKEQELKTKFPKGTRVAFQWRGKEWNGTVINRGSKTLTVKGDDFASGTPIRDASVRAESYRMKITKRQLRRIIREEKARLVQEVDVDIAALSRNIPRQAETIVDKMGDGVWTALGVSNPYASAAEMRVKFPWVNADEVFAFFESTSKRLEELIRNNSGD